MDIFSHGLWAGAAYKALNQKKKTKFNVWMAAFWGVFPDLFAFTIPFVWILWSVTFGGMSFSDLPRPPGNDIEPAPRDALPFLALTSTLYSISHSAVVFAVVFALVWAVWGKPVWELGGWLLHILMDVPTHSYRFFPTPVLWPLSEWKFHGFAWGTPWFLILDYTALLFIYLLLFKKRKAEKRNVF